MRTSDAGPDAAAREASASAHTDTARTEGTDRSVFECPCGEFAADGAVGQPGLAPGARTRPHRERKRESGEVCASLSLNSMWVGRVGWVLRDEAKDRYEDGECHDRRHLQRPEHAKEVEKQEVVPHLIWDDRPAVKAIERESAERPAAESLKRCTDEDDRPVAWVIRVAPMLFEPPALRPGVGICECDFVPKPAGVTLEHVGVDVENDKGGLMRLPPRLLEVIPNS